jgi:hypothetical protein
MNQYSKTVRWSPARKTENDLSLQVTKAQSLSLMAMLLHSTALDHFWGLAFQDSLVEEEQLPELLS